MQLCCLNLSRQKSSKQININMQDNTKAIAVSLSLCCEDQENESHFRASNQIRQAQGQSMLLVLKVRVACRTLWPHICDLVLEMLIVCRILIFKEEMKP